MRNGFLCVYLKRKLTKKRMIMGLTTTAIMAMRDEGHTKVSCPKRFVHSGEVEIHLREVFDGVVSRLESEISHLAKPKVHSRSSPVSILTEDASVSVNQSIAFSLADVDDDDDDDGGKYACCVGMK